AARIDPALGVQPLCRVRTHHRGGIRVVDPAHGRRIVPVNDLRRAYTGVAIICEPSDDFGRGSSRAKGTWRYLRPMLRQSRNMARVIATSLLIRLAALGLPLLTALVVDEIVPRNDHRLLLVLAAVVLVLALLQIATMVLAWRRNQRLMSGSLQAQADTQSYAYELLAGIETLKASGAEHRAAERWGGLFTDQVNIDLTRGRLTAADRKSTRLNSSH